jgi:hypothetical protein
MWLQQTPDLTNGARERSSRTTCPIETKGYTSFLPFPSGNFLQPCCTLGIVFAVVVG